MLNRRWRVSALALGAAACLSAHAEEMPALYNQVAQYKIDMGWDAYLTANYIYWHMSREDFGFYQSNDFTSGYQLGAGFSMAGMDNWEFYSKYTWYRNSRDNRMQKFSYDDIYVTLKRPFYSGKRLVADCLTGFRGLFIDNTLRLL